MAVWDEIADRLNTLWTGKANAGDLTGKVSLSELEERVQDIVGAMLVSGGSLTLAYDDATGKVTLTAPAGSGTDVEAIRDTIGAALVGAQGVTVAINDAADTITVGISGLTISQITNLQTALDAKLTTPAGGTDGQVLTRTSSGYTWTTPATGGGTTPTLDARGAWQPLTLVASLTADPAYPVPAVRLDRSDMVRFRGVVSANATINGQATSTTDTGTVLFNLPASCRPGGRVGLAWPGVGVGSKGLWIMPNGDVRFGAGTLVAGNVMPLEGLTYPL
ncbi:hypothetical protein [Nocardioides sp. AX2bis]|uniref:hypothetical protein n=1 Tax=Nocardioides sp. AX2bis TaxID=2653157 RepID=UPI0012F0848B|nr:hypothetical protein [Nocardioides sp. AX2bis]VXC43837.1 hypothetical protein NOCARDAX2BIS_590005 [Nocardioides sp. AX2bis]